MKKLQIILLLLLSLLMTGCTGGDIETAGQIADKLSELVSELQTENTQETATEEPVMEVLTEDDLYDHAGFTGEPYITVNEGHPFFSEAELHEEFIGQSFELYSELDSLGRCGKAYANIGMDIMPTEERGSIGHVKPTGWHTVKYNDLIDGNYLYNRCHLIAFCLAGENANEKNLITGTRYLNVKGMLPFEIRVCDYVEETGNHVLYRVTPVFKGDNLVAEGVLMEAKSIEDDEIEFCVFCYNVQPGIRIDYETGESMRE